MKELKLNPPHTIIELKRCPFCGGKAKLYRDRPIGVSPCMIKPHVECIECTASIYASSAIQVVDAWNRRVEDDETLSAEPQKTGEWIVNKRLGGRIQCSKCGAFSGLTEDDLKEGYPTANYCFNCGAEMEDGERIKEILKQHEN